MTGDLINSNIDHALTEIVDEVPEKYREQIFNIEYHFKNASKVAQELDSKAFSHFLDEDVVKLIEIERHGGETTPLREWALEMLEQLVGSFENPKPVYDPIWQSICDLLQTALTILLLNEFESRRKQKEKPIGRAVRDFLVDKDETTLKRLVETTMTGFHGHPDDPGSDGKLEIVSMINESLMIQMNKALNGPIKIADEFASILLASLKGRLNFVSRNAHRDVLDELRRALKIQRQRVDPEFCCNEDDDEYPDGMDIYPDTKPNRLNSHVVLERLSGVKGRDKTIVDMILAGKTETDIADEMGITQQAVSIRLKRMKDKYFPNPS